MFKKKIKGLFEYKIFKNFTNSTEKVNGLYFDAFDGSSFFFKMGVANFQILGIYYLLARNKMERFA